MTNCALSIHELEKGYDHFKLNKISFDVPTGSIVGLIGENGAGKSTTIHTVLGLSKKDAGTVTLLGKDTSALIPSDFEQIGTVFDGCNFSTELSPLKLNRVLRDVYRTWDEALYISLLEQMNLPKDKKIKTFSKGMLMKLSIIVALSHHPKLLILDEATSGLDPVMRDDILDLFLNFVQKEDHSILLSSHITSDLEKVADYIVFIHKGELIFSKAKDELLDSYGLIKCGEEQFHQIDPTDIVAFRKMDYEWQVLISDRKEAEKKYKKTMVIPATIDEIMLLYVKGESK